MNDSLSDNGSPSDVEQAAPGAVDRRELLQSSLILLGGEVSTRALRPPSSVALGLAELLESARSTPTVMESVQVAVTYYASSFDEHDFEELYDSLTEHLKIVLGLLRRPAYRHRHDLCLYGARLSGMMALLTHMQGKLNECLSHYGNAYALAEEIGDQGIMSWVMAERAAVAWSVGNAAAVLTLTDGVVDRTRGANRANMVSNLAQAAARTGDRSRAVKLIIAAEAAAEAIPQEENSDRPGTPIWGFSPSSTITNTAIAWLNLGEARLALESAQRSIELLGDHALHRHAAHAKIIAATAHVGLGDPAEASRLATEVIQSAPQDVYIVSRQSTDLLRALDRHRASPEVRQLREVISHYEKRLEAAAKSAYDGDLA